MDKKIEIGYGSGTSNVDRAGGETKIVLKKARILSLMLSGSVMKRI